MTPTEIMIETKRLLSALPTNSKFWKRLRIAITPEEEHALKQYIFDYESKPASFFRILNIPIQVETDPENRPLTVEFPHV